MPLFIVGDGISLAASTTGTLTFKSPVNGTITKIGFGSDSRCEIVNIEITGKPDFFDGRTELDALKDRGNMHHVEPPLDISKGDSIIFDLKDISGATNDVYIVITITY